MSAIVELRQYTLKPGMRDRLIELFDREFVESQEAEGCMVIGQFRDLDNPDRFVWLRGFADMPSRKAALTAFYGGPVWKANREAANATMLDSDNVLLLRPAHDGSGFRPACARRAPVGATKRPPGIIAGTILNFAAPAGPQIIDACERHIADMGVTPIAGLVTEHAENDFPALPVRAGENVFVVFAPQVPGVTLTEWPLEVATKFMRPPEVLRLALTARSKLHL